MPVMCVHWEEGFSTRTGRGRRSQRVKWRSSKLNGANLDGVDGESVRECLRRMRL